MKSVEGITDTVVCSHPTQKVEMLESFEYRGLWWLPEEPGRKVAGVLTFSQDARSLELIGTLPRPEPMPDEHGEVEWGGGPLARERILGLSTDGKVFTLEECHASGFNLSSPGMITERFTPSLILEGAQYGPGEMVLFDELTLRYSQLDAWVATSGFSETFSETDGDIGIDVSFRPPERVVVEVPEATIEIGFAWHHGGGNAPLGTQVVLRQEAAFVLRFDQPTPLKGAHDFVYQLRNFLALGVGRPVTPTRVTGIVLPTDDAEPDPLTGLAPRKLKVNLFYPLGQSPEVKGVHPALMLFTLADARERLATLLQNWFAKQDLLRPVFDLYFGAIYNRQAFLEQRFLSLMQAVETYHRRSSPATELPDEEHEQRLDEILQATPEQYRDWLAKKLTHSNELILRKRLEDVLKRCPQVTEKLLSKRTFIHRVGTARNYLTHYDPGLAEHAPTGLDLYPLAVQLQALVEMCLLLELGFDCEEIDGFFDRVERYREARQS